MTTFIGMLLFLLNIIFIQIARVWYNRRHLRKAANMCPGPPTVPIIGNALIFLGNTFNILKVLDEQFQMHRSNQLPFRLWLGPKLYFFVANADHLEIILNAPNTLEKDSRYEFAEAWVGTGLFSAPVTKWRPHRRAITPTFNQKILNTFVPVFVEQGRELVYNLEKVSDGRVIDIFHYISRCTLDIICETAMGVTVNAQKDIESEYIKAAQSQFEIMMIRMFQLWKGIKLGFYLSEMYTQQKSNLKILHGFSKKIVEEKVEKFRNTAHSEIIGKRKAFLDHLIDSTHGNNEFWSSKDLQEEVDTMIIAGSDTSGSMACFILMLLGIYKDIQQKVVDELLEIYGESSRDPEVEDLYEMKYMELVIKESMRLYPVGPYVVRQVTEDLKLTDYFTLPKGAGVVIGIKSVQKDPRYWGDDVEEFSPERFTVEECRKRHPYCYIPFSGGQRNCVGQRYAVMSMKILLSSILRKYSVGSPFKSHKDIELKADLLLRPVKGYLIKIEKRNVSF